MANEANIHELKNPSYTSFTDPDYEAEGFHNEQLWVKLDKMGKKISFAKDLLALGRYLSDSKVSWQRKAVVSAALVYLVSPVDKLRELKPLFDIFDELGIMEALLKYLGREIIPYYETDYRI